MTKVNLPTMPPKKAPTKTPTKASGKRPHAATETAAASGSEQSPAKKAKVVDTDLVRRQINAAIRDNPPGVRLVPTSGLDMTPLLAGYLNLPDTKALREYIAEVSEMKIYQDWKEARMVGFGVNGFNDKTTWSVKTLLKFASDPAFVDFSDFLGGIPLDLTLWPPHDTTRGYATWLVAMQNIIQERRELFTSTAREESDKETLASIHLEDWHRAYHVLRVMWREKNASRRALKDPNSSKVQTKPAETPLFYTDADLRHAGTKEAATLTAGNEELERYLADEERDQAMLAEELEEEEAIGEESESEQTEEERKAAEEAVFGLFEGTFKNVPTKLEDINKKNWMPQLDGLARGRLLAHIGKSAKVLWPLDVELRAEQVPKPSHPVEGEDGQPEGSRPEAGQDVGQFAEDAVHQADVEGTAQEREMDRGEREKFWELQRTMNNVSSNPVSYAECCAGLGLDPRHPMIGKLLLKPWQVSGAWWTLWQWRYGLGSMLLSDDVGLGKTITTLAALQLGLDLVKTSAKLNAVNLNRDLALKPPYKPTLVVCPASAFTVWKEELTHFPGLSLHLWVGSIQKAEVTDRYRTLGTRSDAVLELANKFEDSDPAAAGHIILTTYQTFHSRSLRFEDVETPSKKGKGREVIGQSKSSDDQDEDIDNDDDDDEPELSEEQLRRLKTLLPGVFGIIIADESHKLKSVRTRTHQAVLLTCPTNILMISATPTINRPVDLYGTLSLIWRFLRREWFIDRPEEAEDSPLSELDEFQEAFEGFDKLTSVNLVDFRGYLPYLYPKSFLAIANREKQLSTATAVGLLPIILTLIQLRRVKGQQIEVMGDMVTIGQDIPPYRVTTVELEMSIAEYKAYLAAHEKLVPRLSAGSFEDGAEPVRNEGRMNMAVHRLLSHICMHPGLDAFAKTKKASTQNVVTWNDREDYGYGFFHRLTRLDESAPVYRERVGAAISVSARSVKLQWLAGKVFDVCVSAQENLIVFVAWPVTQWLVEMFLTTVGVPVLSIRAAHTRAQRSETQEAFNNASTVGHVLITSLKCGATSMNLQKNCSTVVFLDVADSANIAAQAIGRVHRIGQTKVQEVYIVTKNHSYDQKVQAHAARKMYGQIAGQSDLTITGPEFEAAREEASNRKQEEDGSSDASVDADSEIDHDKDAIIEIARDRKVMKLYMATFGQRSPRQDWDDIRDLSAKDSLSSEAVTDRMIKREFPTHLS